MLRVCLLVLLSILPRAAAAPCVCHSIGNVTYKNSNQPTNLTGAALVSALAVANGTDFMWSNDPAMHNLTAALYARPVYGTFACACEDTARAPMVRYIVSGLQSNASAVPVRECLGTDTMSAACATLAQMRLMTCNNVWSTGMSGFAHTAAVETGVLVDAVRKLCKKRVGACAETVTFTGALDSVTTEVLL